MSTTRIAFIGAGNMAASLIGGLRAQGVDADSIRASDPGAETRGKIAAEHGIAVFADNAEAIEGADVVLIAVKPQAMKAVCEALRPSLKPNQLVVSIAAGITSGQLDRWLGGGQAVVRAMPNTPALLGAGVTGLFATAGVSAAQRAQADTVLASAGRTVWIEDEARMDTVTAVSGSGPAYVFLLAEAMEAAGIAQGLPAEAARTLVVQTLLGASRMLDESGEAPAELRRRVTSPNGTTEAAIKSFQAGGFEALVETALGAAAHRSAEMAEQLGK